MLEKRRAIDARAREIVEESGALWAVAVDQARAELGDRMAKEPSRGDEPSTAVHGWRDGEVVTSASRVGAVVAGLVAVGSTHLLWFGHIDICADSAGWWIALVLVSPLFFVGLCGLCAIVAPSNAQKAVWVSFMALVSLLYLPSLVVTVVGGGMASASC